MSKKSGAPGDKMKNLYMRTNKSAHPNYNFPLAFSTVILGGTATTFVSGGERQRRSSIDEEAAATRRVVVADERLFKTGKHGKT